MSNVVIGLDKETSDQAGHHGLGLLAIAGIIILSMSPATTIRKASNREEFLWLGVFYEHKKSNLAATSLNGPSPPRPARALENDPSIRCPSLD